ncbi:lipopolysaccharide biosynthesis protein [Eggerthellaceae bacterium zg-1084]|uniref:Lipopolysaccharide biosynthesis protein n=1 Tax=Berryella wangjianweii TaxID=2734634 RepID=A0A6M8J4F1_9ACTN|nr:lipopolysaccharide biosynthesis protein [Berryella wangjianweii]NPD31315.1 lipopolysaccharide biosynthesis protein [Berryella wangjianweii]QKF06856.1 lipopolysaccharide biosynthesis protein [Berryella wangjianweii]
MSVRHSASGQTSRAPGRKRRLNIFAALFNPWWDRLVGAVADGGLSAAEEEYEAHSTSRDYVWNTVGLIASGVLFPLLTVVATQLVGVERAGMFSLAFVMANLLFFVGSFGVRTYQISDLDGAHSFLDYQAHRLATCAVMIVGGLVLFSVRGYADEMLMMSVFVMLFKAVDALADVYEGRLQQVDKLYLGGISQTIRFTASLLAFLVLLAITRSLAVASAAMFLVALVSFALVTFPLALLETPKSNPLHPREVMGLFRSCAPLFLAVFMYALVDSMPKFVMEGALSYDSQLYFNALYFPAQAILITVGLIYKPQLVRMAALWADPLRRRGFDLMIVAMVVVIVGVTVLAVGGMKWVGLAALSLMYGIDFTQYAELAYIMLAAGGVTAGIDFLYQVIVILRRQRVVTELYVITLGFSVLVLMLMVNITGLDGAVIGYLVVMSILFVLLVREYISVRVELARADRGEVEASVLRTAASASPVSQALLSDERERARRALRARRSGLDAADVSFNRREDARRRLSARRRR